MNTLSRRTAAIKMKNESYELVDLYSGRKSDNSEEDIVYTKPAITLRKELTVLNGVTLIIGNIIGSGIFFTPPIVLCHTGSFGVAMLTWLAGAFIALAGALCYVELGFLVRSSGGDYSFLLEGYSFSRRNKAVTLLGECVAFLYIWCSVVIMRPGGFAVLSLTCAEYLVQPFFIDCEPPVIVVKLLALSVLITVSLVNAYSVRATAGITTIVTILKLFSIFSIAVIGIGILINKRSFPEENLFQPREGFTLTASSLALALYGVLWSYDGWSVIFYAFEETRNVEKTLPRSLFIGIPIVALCYLIVNLAYFGVLSYSQILSSEAVALKFGHEAFGYYSFAVIPLIVALSIGGAAVGSVFAGSRITFAAARDGMFLRMFSGIHVHNQTPLPAITLQCIGGCLVLLFGDISQLLSGLSAVLFLFYTLIHCSLLIMRVTRPYEPRPFKGWFIIPIAVFSIIVSIILTFLPIQQKPWPSLMAFGVLLLGLPVYVCFVMEEPWRLRPKFLDSMNDKLTEFSNNLFNSSIPK